MTVAVCQRCNVLASDYHTSTYVTMSRLAGRSSGLPSESVWPEYFESMNTSTVDYTSPGMITAAGLICEAVGT